MYFMNLKADHKIMWKHEGSRKAKTISKMNKFGRLKISNYKTNFDIVIKTFCYQYKVRYFKVENRKPRNILVN